MKDFNRNGSKSIPEQRWRGRRGSSQNISLSIFNLLGSMTSRLIFSFNLTGAQIRSVSWFYVRTHKKSHRNIPSNCLSVVKMPNGHTIVWIYSFSPLKFLHKWHVCVVMLTSRYWQTLPAGCRVQAPFSRWWPRWALPPRWSSLWWSSWSWWSWFMTILVLVLEFRNDQKLCKR